MNAVIDSEIEQRNNQKEQKTKEEQQYQSRLNRVKSIIGKSTPEKEPDHPYIIPKLSSRQKKARNV